MGRVRYSKAAREDLLNIWLWIAPHNLTAADAVIDRIESRAAMLGRFPAMGVARPEIGEGARSLVVERRLVLYRIMSEGAQIVRIMDGACDLSRLEWPRVE